MTQAVTELIVRGDGALATLDKFDDKMVAAGQATDRSTGAVARYNAAMAQMSAAQEKGLAITTQKVERQTAEQRAMERWQGTVDKTMQLEIRLRREAQRAAVDTANAVALGYATQEQGLATLTKLEQIHAAQLAESAALSQRMAGVQGAASGRYDAATAAINRQTNALRQNHSAGSFNTANIAAQFQDIGVTSAMGMSPIQIALQQGTQLSAVFEQMKASGQGVGAGLRAAFMSVISPMSLVTVGAIAITAAIVQFATTLGGKANPEAEEFSKWLEKIGSDANTAAEFLERVNKAVHDLTVVDLNKLQRQGKAYIDQQRAQLANPLMEAAGWEGALNDPKFVETYNLIDKVLGKLRSDDGFKNLDDLHKSLSAIVAERPDLQKLAEGWEELGEAILKAKEAAAQAAHEAELAMHGMSAYQGRDGAAMQKYLDQNVETLRELRKEREAAFAQLYAKSPSELAAAARKQAEMARNPTQSPDANKYREDTAAALAYAQAIKQITDANEDRLRSLDQTLLSQKLETALIGAGVRLRAAASLEFQQTMEIHEEAIRNGITSEKEFQEVYGDLIAKIHERAKAYGEEAEAAAKANLERNLAFERDQLGRTDVDQRVASQLRDLYGDKYVDHMNGAIAGQIRYNEELTKTDELARDAFDTIIDALTSSGDLADNLIKAFAQIGKMFAQIGQQKIFDWISGKSSSLFGNIQSAPMVGGGVSVVNAGREAGRAMAQPISDRFASVGEDLAANIHAAASTLGVSARDLATVISYESGFRTDAVNPDGKHIGLIQFGPEEQRKYGVSIGQALSDQMQAVVNYLKDRGLKPGMDLLDLYSTINAGSPGHYNAVDGTTTVSQKVAGMASHQAAADRILGKEAVSDGVVDAGRRMAAANQNDPWGDHLRQTSVATNGGGGMQGLLGVGGAALGAFAGGYQSGSPIMGGISGAMSGVGAAGAISSTLGIGLGAATGIGLIGGAIIGIIGGILGKAKQKREELKKAQQELEGQIGAITNLIRTSTHNYLGAMEKEFGDTVDEFQKAITLAEKAKNSKLVQQLKEAQQEFFDRLVNDWNKAFQGTLESLNAGLGMDGEFLKGMDAVDKMRESLVGFVNDAKFFAEANGDLSSMLDARKKELGTGQKGKEIQKPKDEYIVRMGSHDTEMHENKFIDGYKELGLQLIEKGFQAFNDQGGQLYDTLTALTEAATKMGFAIDEAGKVTRVVNDSIVDAVKQAQEAAQKSALATLSGGKTFSEIEQAIQRLQGAAASLPELLEDLGMSAEDAAKAIQFHLNIALRDLRNGLASDLQSSINDLSGFGFLNDLLGAQTSYEARVKDLKALGMDAGLAMQELGLRLRNIAKDADLTDDQLKQLANVFPQLGTSLTSLIGASVGTTSQALEDAKAAVEEAKSALRASYEKEISTLDQAKSAHDGYVKSIKDFIQSIKLDSSLSPLDPTQRFQEAQSQFLDITQKALGGDEEAIGKVEDVSRQYLEEARAYYGTSEGYFSIFNEVNDVLNKVLASSQDHLSDLDQQLSAMKDQMDAQLGTTDAVLSVEDAIAKLAEATAAEAAAQDAFNSAQQALFQQMLELLKQTGQAYDPTITGMYRDVLGRAPDAEGAAYYTQMLNSGMSVEELLAKFTANAQPELDRGYATPAYASGGFHSGGLRLVGENGPELESTGASRIWNASDTARMLRQSFTPQNFATNDNSGSAMLKELQAVKAELSALRAERKQGDGVVAAGAQATVGAAQETTQAVKIQIEAARRAGGRRTG